jgi:anti-sigma factor RsiW
MAECTTYRPMIGSREGELAAAERAALEAHLAGCQGCRRFAADLAATEGLVSEALLAAAARRDFAPFVDGVMARVRAGRVGAGRSHAPGPSRPEPAGVLSRLLAAARLHPRLAVAALAPILAALALVVYVRVEDRPELAQAALLELTTEGNATMILQTVDGPVVLLSDDQPS